MMFVETLLKCLVFLFFGWACVSFYAGMDRAERRSQYEAWKLKQKRSNQ